MYGTFLFACLIVASGFLYFYSRRLARKKFELRSSRSVDEIVGQLPTSVSHKKAREVLVKIGESFGVNPEKLRLDDQFSALIDIDSWHLGEGQEKLEKWITSQGMKLSSNPKTIGDLVIALASN